MINNIWLTWGDVFNSSLQSLWWSFVQFTPKLVVAIVLFIVGWVVGALIAKAIEQVFVSLKIDSLCFAVDEFFEVLRFVSVHEFYADSQTFKLNLELVIGTSVKIRCGYKIVPCLKDVCDCYKLGRLA